MPASPTPSDYKVALNRIAQALWPDGDADHEWTSDTLAEVADVMRSLGMAPESRAGLRAFYARHCLRAGRPVSAERLAEVPDSDDYEWFPVLD